MIKINIINKFKIKNNIKKNKLILIKQIKINKKRTQHLQKNLSNKEECH